jgi:hypothetical protein
LKKEGLEGGGIQRRRRRGLKEEIFEGGVNRRRGRSEGS